MSEDVASTIKLNFDMRSLVTLGASLIAVAVSYATMQSNVDSLTKTVATLESKLNEVPAVDRRLLVVETKFQSIDEKLGRIEGVLGALTSQRAALDTDSAPAVPRTARR